MNNLATQPYGSRVYATGAEGTVYGIDPDSGTIVGSVFFGGASVPQDIVASSFGEVYATLQGFNEAAALDSNAQFEFGRVPVGPAPEGIAILENFNATGAVELFKRDEFGNPLQGAFIRVRGLSVPFDFSGITDFNGRLFLGDLPLGEYEIVEIIPPPGYEPVYYPYRFAILKPGEIQFIEILNFRRIVEFFLRKLDAETGAPLAGAEFRFSGPDVLDVVTDANGQAVVVLQPGVYFVEETRAPEGYEPVEPFYIDTNYETYREVLDQRRLEPRVELVKSSGGVAQARPGDLIPYTIEVINTGNTVLRNLVVSDLLLGFEERVDQLNPGESLFFSIPYVVQAGTPAGPLDNVATAVSEEASAESEASVEILPVPVLLLSKRADRPSVVEGSEVIYTIELANGGNVPLTDVRLSDSLLPVPVGPFSLAIGETREVSVPVTAGPPFIVDGRITNVATATSGQTAPVQDTAVVLVLAGPESLRLVKSVSPDAVRLGETAVFEFELTNTGSVRLTNVTLNDPVLGLVLTFDQILPGESVRYEQPYTPDVVPPGGVLTNRAAAVSSGPEGEVRSNEASATLKVIAVPALALSKTADRAEVIQGNTVTYTIRVVNVGDVPLTNVRVTDVQLSLNETILSLPPGQEASFIRAVTVPLAVPPGTLLINTVSAVSNQTGLQEDTAEVLVLPFFRLELEKLADRTVALPGETIQYRIVVTNTGGADLTAVSVQDALLSISESINRLVPGEQAVFGGELTVPPFTPEGTVIANVATAISDQTPLQSDDATVTVGPLPALALQKAASVPSALPGDEILYTFTLLNIGNVLLTNVRVTDPLTGLDSIVPTLAPGGEISLTATFVVPADAPPQTVLVNTAAAASDQTAPVEASARVAIAPASALTIVKSADRTEAAPLEAIAYTIVVTNAGPVRVGNVLIADEEAGVQLRVPALEPGESISVPAARIVPPGTPAAFPGETVVYSATVLNTGNTTLTNVVLTDSRIGLEARLEALEPGAAESFRQPYAIPEDAAAGSVIDNTASAASDQTAPVFSSVSLAVRAGFSLTLDKSVAPASALPGETVRYSIVVRNASNAPVTNVRLVDQMIGFSQLITEIPAGRSVVLFADYRVPRTAPGGSLIVNRTTAISDQTSPIQDTATVAVRSLPRMQLAKAAIPAQGRPGQTIAFQIRLRNVGNVPLSPLRVTDPLLGIDTIVSVFSSGSPASLIGAGGTVSVPYTIPETAAPGSTIVNTVRADSPQTDPQSAEAAVLVLPSLLQVRKSADRQTTYPGDVVRFRIEARNVSDRPLSGLALFDRLQSGLQLVPGSLAIGGATAPRQSLEGAALGDLAPGAAVELSFQARVPASLQAGLIANFASVRYAFVSESGSSERASARSNTVELTVTEEEE
ncbi:putative internalin [Paenibacillus pasadenensis]|uniref:Putative internalin n=1 Tax=Paenibacillus pasadenensis TaxID=217090 RepID=A0A2N5NCC0_9BACL|nr:SpaA isopeptide-forming pilin-related protein [Paenibacillus pasadenensis]PLT47987.1 putative internalin [Paenibacillus pasadenensis]